MVQRLRGMPAFGPLTFAYTYAYANTNTYAYTYAYTNTYAYACPYTHTDCCANSDSDTVLSTVLSARAYAHTYP